jgi:hypothetical protein
MAQAELGNTLIKLTLIWFGTSIGYYYIIPIFGFGISYNLYPITISAYYAVCSFLVATCFHGDYFKKRHKVWLLFSLLLLSFFIISIFLYSFSSLSQLQALKKVDFYSSYIEILLANK